MRCHESSLASVSLNVSTVQILKTNVFNQLLLVCLLLSFLLLLLLSIYLLASEKDNFSVESACFLVFCRIAEYISLDLFYFVNLTSSCTLRASLSGTFLQTGRKDVVNQCLEFAAVVHSFLSTVARNCYFSWVDLGI